MSKRPTYESEEDRANEQAVIDGIAGKFGLTSQKLPISYGLDYALYKKWGQLSSFVEVKCRNNESTKYKTIMVSLLKVMKAKELSDATGARCLFVVEWTDRLGIFDLCKPDFIGWGGRVDRNDNDDMEPVAHWAIGSSEWGKM